MISYLISVKGSQLEKSRGPGFKPGRQKWPPCGSCQLEWRASLLQVHRLCLHLWIIISRLEISTTSNLVAGGRVRDCQRRRSGRRRAGRARRTDSTRGATNGNRAANIGPTPGRESSPHPTLPRTALKAPARWLPTPRLPLATWTCLAMCGSGCRIGGCRGSMRRRPRKAEASCATRAIVTDIAVLQGHRIHQTQALIILASDVLRILCQIIWTHNFIVITLEFQNIFIPNEGSHGNKF